MGLLSEVKCAGRLRLKQRQQRCAVCRRTCEGKLLEWIYQNFMEETEYRIVAEEFFLFDKLKKRRENQSMSF